MLLLLLFLKHFGLGRVTMTTLVNKPLTSLLITAPEASFVYKFSFFILLDAGIQNRSPDSSWKKKRERLY